MRVIFMIMCFPLFAAAQNPGRQDDSLRKISDTMQFPKPFAFERSATTNLEANVLTTNCYNWVTTIKDSLKSIVILKDSVHNKLMARNVPATADITFTIFIEISGSKYTCILRDYIYHTVNGKSLPVAKAAMLKDYKETTNIEKVIIMRNYQWVFDSLSKYLEKKSG